VLEYTCKGPIGPRLVPRLLRDQVNFACKEMYQFNQARDYDYLEIHSLLLGRGQGPRPPPLALIVLAAATSA
jgi:hypothetical protein